MTRSEALETFLTLRATWSNKIVPGDAIASAWREVYRRAINRAGTPWDYGRRLYALQRSPTDELFTWRLCGHKQLAEALVLTIERSEGTRWTVIAPDARHAWQGDVSSLYDARLLLGVEKTAPVIDHGSQESIF